MRETATRLAWIVCFMILIFCRVVFSQEAQADIDELKKQAPRVFIDCRRCDMDYIRTEITFVNYVWDRREADIHVLITTQSTGSGGTEYTMAFIGQKDYEDYQNTLRFVSGSTDTPDEMRQGYVKVLKMGLVAVAARTPIAERIVVDFKEQVRETAVEDPWNFWVFNFGAHGFYIGQSHTSMLDGDLSIRIVKGLRLNIDGSFSRSRVQQCRQSPLRRRESWRQDDILLIYQISVNFS